MKLRDGDTGEAQERAFIGRWGRTLAVGTGCRQSIDAKCVHMETCEATNRRMDWLLPPEVGMGA